jgi:tRNA dimethylallyltransferase
MLVYRGMDLGTAKPSPEERAVVPHHLIDVSDPGEDFSVARYQALARRALRGIASRGNRALLIGGSGLYFRAMVDDLALPTTDPAIRRDLETEAAAFGAGPLYARLRASDPEAADKIEPGNVRRTVRALEVAAITGRPFSSFAERWERYPADHVRAAGVEASSAVLAERIERRIREMMARGFLEEVRRLAERGVGPSLTARQAIGYAEMIEHLEGRLALDDALASTMRRTKALARRQMAWFRKDPRLRWFRAGEEGAAGIVDQLAEYLQG